VLNEICMLDSGLLPVPRVARSADLGRKPVFRELPQCRETPLHRELSQAVGNLAVPPFVAKTLAIKHGDRVCQITIIASIGPRPVDEVRAALTTDPRWIVWLLVTSV